MHARLPFVAILYSKPPILYDSSTGVHLLGRNEGAVPHCNGSPIYCRPRLSLAPQKKKVVSFCTKKGDPQDHSVM